MPKAQFCWEDPLLLDAQLSSEERQIRDAARDYCQGKLMPRVTEAFRHERTDPEIFREMGAMGLLGPTVSPEYGGAGLNYVAYGLIAREVERVDSGYRSMMSVRYVLPGRIFQLLVQTTPGAGGEIQLTDAIDALLKERGKVLAYRFEGIRFDCGNKAGLVRATMHMAMQDPKLAPTVRAFLGQL